MLGAIGSGARGVIVAGAGTIRQPEAVHGLAERLGWPVLADPRSGARTPAPTTVAAADAFLRHPAHGRPALAPEVVILRLGEPPVSKVLNEWLDASPAPPSRSWCTPRAR